MAFFFHRKDLVTAKCESVCLFYERKTGYALAQEELCSSINNVNYPLSKANGLPASSTSYTHRAHTYYLHRR